MFSSVELHVLKCWSKGFIWVNEELRCFNVVYFCGLTRCIFSAQSGASLFHLVYFSGSLGIFLGFKLGVFLWYHYLMLLFFQLWCICTCLPMFLLFSFHVCRICVAVTVCWGVRVCQYLLCGCVGLRRRRVSVPASACV